MSDLHERRVTLICTPSNGVQPLRQVSAIPDGFAKNRSQIWRLSADRAYNFNAFGLIDFDHRPGRGTYGYGSTRTKSLVAATEIGRQYVELCKEACRLSNLSWQEGPYGSNQDTGYIAWQAEWRERREAFQRALMALAPPAEQAIEHAE